MAALWTSIGSALVRRGRIVLAVVLAATAVFGVGLTRLRFETSQASMIEPSTDVYKANERFQDAFGGEPMLVLLSGPIDELLSPTNIPRLEALEDELRATGEFDAVVGPIAALDFALGQLDVAPTVIAGAAERDRAAAPDDAARAEVDARYAELLATESARLGEAGERSLDNPAMVQFLLREADGTIRPALQDTFLDDSNAVLLVRLPGNISIADQGKLSTLTRDIVARHPLEGIDVLATGPPVLLKEINDYLRGGMTVLGTFAAIVMIVLLFTVFRARWRLLSLGVVCIGLVWAFGMLGFLDVPLSMVTISGLPILLGLGVDFAVQTHNRFEEQLRRGDNAILATPHVMQHMAVPLTIAMGAAVAGFLALQLSEVPMIDDFGVLLAVGMVVLVVEAIVVTVGALVWRERRRTPAATGEPAPGRLGRAVNAATRLDARWALALAGVTVVLGAAGLVVEGTTPIQTDPEAWVGSDASSVKELVRLRDGTGYSTELELLVEADDVTSDEVAAWMDAFVDRQRANHPDELVGGTSLANIASWLSGSTPSGADVQALLDVAPPDVAKSFISADHTQAAIVLPIANLSLKERETLLDEMVADLNPPPGVTVTPAGLAVVGIKLVDALEANRQVLTITALGLVALWLLLVFRRPVTVILTLVPVIAAVGGSALAIDRLGLELTPLTTVTGPLAIAITTEFAVLLVTRYLEERGHGAPPDEAVDRAATRIGRAFVASGLTLLGGFVVLGLSPMPLLIDFGLVVAIDVALALVTVLVFLPPLLRRTAIVAPAELVLDLEHAVAAEPHPQEVLL